MRISRFFVDLPLSVETSIELPADVARYAVSVLRLPLGASLILFNGDNCNYLGRISAIEKKRVVVEVIEQKISQVESALPVCLVQAISRGERMDYALQKAVELGVHSIWPVTSERCGVNLKGDRLQKRHLHWQGVIRSACEQSGRSVLPVLRPQATLEGSIAALAAEKMDLILMAPNAEKSIKNISLSGCGVAVLIGPEGGFSESEIATAVAAGCQSVRFGPRILRTETAAVAVLTALQVVWGDLG